MPNDFVASRSLAAANPAAARSSASSHEAGRRLPPSRTRGSVSRTCLLIERNLPDKQLPTQAVYSECSDRIHAVSALVGGEIAGQRHWRHCVPLLTRMLNG